LSLLEVSFQFYAPPCIWEMDHFGPYKDVRKWVLANSGDDAKGCLHPRFKKC